MKSFFGVILLTIATVCCGTSALAQNAPPATAPDTTGAKPVPEMGGAFFKNLGGAATNIKSKTDSSLSKTLFNTGLSFSKGTVTWSLGIAGALATLYLIIESIGVMMQKNASMLTVLFDIGLPVILCAYLLLNYESLIVGFAGADGLLDFVRKIGGDASLTIMDMYSAILKLVGSAIYQSWIGFGKAFSISPDLLSNIMAAAVDVIGTILFGLVIIVLSFSGLAEILGLVMMGPFLCAIAVAFGPIFIAGVVTPWTREYFTKWLGFLVTTAVLTGVVNVCVAIASTLFQTFDFAAVAGDTTPSATALLIAAIILVSVNSLIQQAPSIASAMVPGSLGASRGSGGGLRDGAAAAKGKGNAIGKHTDAIVNSAKNRLGSNSGAAVGESASSPLATAGSRYPSLEYTPLH